MYETNVSTEFFKYTFLNIYKHTYKKLLSEKDYLWRKELGGGEER